MIFTFYSYKGGVGRSMALANVAECFYQKGLRVLMVDWDLEAPGLERFFNLDPQAISNNLGVMDMIQDYKKKKVSKIFLWDSKELPLLKVDDLAIDIGPNKQSAGKLFLLTAGRRDVDSFKDYARYIMNFDWLDFYKKWQGELYFEWLRRQFNKFADIVLLDSRTGLSEMGGVCTFQLADVITLFCSPNRQSLDGTYEMAKNFKKSELLKYRRGRPIDVLIVPSRIEDRFESQSLSDFHKIFNEKFTKFSPVNIDTSEFFWSLKIPYIPLFAFQETIAVREDYGEESKALVSAYDKLTTALGNLSDLPSVSYDSKEAFSRKLAGILNLLSDEAISLLLLIITRKITDRIPIDYPIKRDLKSMIELEDNNLILIKNDEILLMPMALQLKDPAILKRTIQLFGSVNQLNIEAREYYNSYFNRLKVTDESIKEIFLPPKYVEDIILLKPAYKERINLAIKKLEGQLNIALIDKDINLNKVLSQVSLDNGNEDHIEFEEAFKIGQMALEDKLEPSIKKSLDAIKRYPKFKEYYLDILKYSISQLLYFRKFDEASFYLEEYIRVGGECSWYNLKKGLIQILLGNEEASRPIFNRVLSYARELHNIKMEAYAYYYLGIYHRVKGEYEKAIILFSKAIYLFTNFDKGYMGRAHLSRGISYRSLDNYTLALNDYQSALQIFENLHDDYRIACVKGRIGTTLAKMELFEKARDYYDQSLEIFKYSGDRSRLAYVIKEMGNLYFAEGQWDLAAERYNFTKKILDEMDKYSKMDRIRYAQACYNLGVTYFIQGFFDKSLTELKEARIKFRNEDDIYDETSILSSLGLIYRVKDKYEESLSYYKIALENAKIVGNLNTQHYLMGRLGDVFRALRRYEDSLAIYEKSLEIIRVLRDGSVINRLNEASILGEIGKLYRMKNSLDISMIYLEESLAIFQNIGNKSGVSWILEELGQVYAGKQLYTEAISKYEESMKLLPDQRYFETEDLYDNAELFVFQGRFKVAIDKYHEALKVLKERRNIYLLGKILRRLGSAYRELSQYEKAAKYLKDSLNFATILKDRDEIGKILTQQGVLYSDQKFYKKSIKKLKAAINVFKRIEDVNSMCHVKEILGLVYLTQHKWSDALNEFKEVVRINPDSIYAHTSICLCYRKLNTNPTIIEDECKLTRKLIERDIDKILEYDLASFESVCGEVGKSLELLEKAFKSDEKARKLVLGDPHFELIRSDKRFQSLIHIYTYLAAYDIYPFA